jgi:hypothetical protein
MQLLSSPPIVAIHLSHIDCIGVERRALSDSFLPLSQEASTRRSRAHIQMNRSSCILLGFAGTLMKSQCDLGQGAKGVRSPAA